MGIKKRFHFPFSVWMLCLIVLLCVIAFAGIRAKQTHSDLIDFKSNHTELRLQLFSFLSVDDQPKQDYLIQNSVKSASDDAERLGLNYSSLADSYKTIISLQQSGQSSAAYRVLNTEARQQFEAIEQQLLKSINQNKQAVIWLTLLFGFISFASLGSRCYKLYTIKKDLIDQGQDSELMFQAIFNGTFQFIGFLEIDGRITKANKAALQFAGIEESDIAGKYFWDTPWWQHSVEMQQWLQQATQQAANGELIRREITHPTPDGDLFYVDFSLKPIFDEAGNVTHLIAEGRDLNERKKYEQELKAQEKEYLNLLDQLPHSIFRFDKNGKIVFINRVVETLFGVQRNDLIGQVIESSDHSSSSPSKQGVMNQMIQHIFESDTLADEELEWETLLGARSFQIQRIQELDEFGEVINVLGIATDITESKHSQDQLRLLSFAMDSVGDAVFLMNYGTPNFGYVNQAAVNKLGYSREELTGGMGVFDIDPDWNQARWDVLWPKLVKARQMKFETRHKTKDGVIFPVEIIAYYFEYDGKEYFLSICPDITKRKQIERELQQYRENLEQLVSERTKALSKSEQRMRLFFERQLVGMAITSPEKGWLDVNDKLCQILGYSREELMTRTWDQLTHPEDLLSDINQFERLLAGEIDNYILEKRFIRKDGSTVFTKRAVGCVRHEDGSVDYLLSLIEDITEQKLYEKEIKQSNVELLKARDAAEAANKAKSSFLTNMSHELRTPLNVILGYSQLLANEEGDNPELKDGLSSIQNSGEHLLGLINNILDLAKLEADKVELDKGIVNLREFLSQVANLIRVKVEEKDLIFKEEIDSDLPKLIYADEGYLRQILLNLLSNAVKFTQKGSIVLSAKCMHINDTATVSFEVKDSGVGIPDDDIDTIFDPFEQVVGVQKKFGGTGLGLAITSRLIKKMGGEIKVESSTGQGSRFWFDLTFERAAENEVLDTESKWALPSGYSGPKKQVLIVDDIETNRKVLTSLLTRLGFDYLEAENGQQGVEMALKHVPDIIMMDIIMPVMDGMDACRELRNHDVTKNIPIIVLSANSSHVDEEKAIESGADEFLSKPVQFDLLIPLLSQLMGLEWLYDKK